MAELIRESLESEKRSWEITLENSLYRHFKNVYQFNNDNSSIAASFIMQQLPIIANTIESYKKINLPKLPNYEPSEPTTNEA